MILSDAHVEMTMLPSFNMRLLVVLCLAGCARSRSVSDVSLVVEGAHDVVPISTNVVNAHPNMVKVEGDYCPVVEEVCTDPVGGEQGRCNTFRYPTKCLTKTVHKTFYIDVYELPNAPGQKPTSWSSWYDVKRSCELQDKRLCTKSEWTFACEGPDMRPYPYGDGYHRDKTACNFDNDGRNVWADTREKRALDDLLVPSGSMARCVSPFGVHDMVGNIDEWIVNETRRPYQSALVGGHVFGVRNACRPMTEGHNETFAWYETGGRCCQDVN